jgi:hypothetical protein
MFERQICVALCAAAMAGAWAAPAASATLISNYEDAGGLRHFCLEGLDPCPPDTFQLGVDVGRDTAADIFAPGTYHYSFTVDPSAVSHVSVGLLDFGFYDFSIDGMAQFGPGGTGDGIGQIQPLSPPTATPTGFEGDFVIPENFDVTTVVTENGVDPVVRRGAIFGYGFEIQGWTLGPQGTAYDLTISQVPEPATWAMMLLGFLGVGAAVRRRRRSCPA